MTLCHTVMHQKKERHLYRGQRHMVNLKKSLLWTNEVLPRGRFSWQYLPNFCLKKRKIKGVLWTSYFINGKKISNLSLLDVRELVNRPSTPICDCWLGLFYTWTTKTKTKTKNKQQKLIFKVMFMTKNICYQDSECAEEKQKIKIKIRGQC